MVDFIGILLIQFETGFTSLIFFIKIVWRLISRVWYSIITDVTRRSFFNAGQELKQGDPLSPSLFIIGVEVLSRLLNRLFFDYSFIPFSMSVRGHKINHLAYEDDITIFSSGNSISVDLIIIR